MTEDKRFDLDADLLDFASGPVPESDPEPEPDAPPQSAPVVMIEYRNRGIPPVLLFPATLVLSLGMFAAYHYLFVAPRQRELQERARLKAAEARERATDAEPVKAAPVEPTPPAMGLSLDSQPIPAGYEIPLPPPTFTEKEEAKATETARVAAKPVETKPVEAPAPSKPQAPNEPPPAAAAAPPPAVVVEEPEKRPAPPPAIGFTPPSETTAPAEPKPAPTREDMMRALQAEAEANLAARAEQDVNRERARVEVEAEAQDRLEAERGLFHDALRRIVAAGGPMAEAGQQIDELCDQFGRTYSNDVKAQVLAALSQYHGRVSRGSEVNLLRSIGVPEAGILDYLANTLEHRSINSRNGPGTQNGVRVLAAKQLLRSPPSNAPRAGAAAPLPPPARPRDPVRRTRPASSVRLRPSR